MRLEMFFHFCIIAITMLLISCATIGGNFMDNSLNAEHAEQREDYNLAFETISNPDELPDGWIKWGFGSQSIQIDSIVTHTGNYSLRIESIETTQEDDWVGPVRSIPAIFSGETVTVKAFLKAEGVSQPGGLLLRVSGDERTLYFNSMQRDRFIVNEEWTEYLITLPLPEEADTIHISALLIGTGKLWIDGFRLFIDDIEISQAPLKPIRKYKADEDTEFSDGSKINITSYSPQTITNLELLGRIWGFMKYYHPAVADGEYNWDAELFRVMADVLEAGDINELNEIFIRWVDSYELINSGELQSPEYANIKLFPNYDWMDNQMISETLSQKLKSLINVRRQSDNFYINLKPGLGNPNFKREKPYTQMNIEEDSGLRLLALYRYWNMIEYFFPYKYQTDQDWNTVLGKFIPIFLDAKTELSYKQAILQLIAHINDTHSIIWSDNTLETWKGLNKAPYNLSFIEDNFVVTAVWEGDEYSTLKIGDIITHVDGKTTEQIINDRLPYTPASNRDRQLSDIAIDLLRTSQDKISVQILRSGETHYFDVDCLPHRIPPEVVKETFKLMSSDIGYIWLETLKSETVAEVMDAFKDTKGIIIDIRGYPRDFSVLHTLGNYLLPQPKDFVIFTIGSVEQPGLFIFGEAPPTIGIDNEDYYKGKVIIIVNERTMSRAEYFSMAFQTAPRAKVIGSITAAADGEVSGILLPGSVQTMITGMGVYYPDGKQTQRVGIALDEIVKPTIQGIIQGRDELLERAMEIINEIEKE